MLTATVEQLPEAVSRLARERRELEKKLAAMQAQMAASRAAAYVADAEEADGVPYLAVRMRGDEGVGPRELADSIRSKWRSGIIVVAAAADGKASLVVNASEDVAGRGVTARALFNALAAGIDGKGGGTATLAQGGGKNVAGIDAALAAVPDAIRSILHA